MANRFAIATGNWSSTATWSTTAGGSGGASVPVAGDNAYANSRTVTIDVNATCTKVSNEAENGATVGGSFSLSAGVILTANVVSGTGSQCLNAAYSSPNSATIIGSISGQTGNQSVLFSGSGTLNVTGDVTGSTGVSGSIAPGITHSGSGTLNVTGSVTAGTLNSSNGITVTGTGPCYVTGNCTGAASGAGGHGCENSGLATVTITGNVTGGAIAAKVGVKCSGSGTVNIIGAVSGGSSTTAYGAWNSSSGTINITGSSTASNTSSGASNDAGGTLKVTRAVGNGWGLGSVGLTSQVGVASLAANSVTYVEEIEYGSLGQSPTSGAIRLTDVTTNRALFYRFGSTKKTLYDPANIAGVLPSVTDVRYGTSYNSGGSVGTCYVPAAGSVAFGVNVDATTGTALLTAAAVSAAVWDALTSGMATSGSIGERLKNCSTVASTGQQLSDALTG
jgi:hypothetical protein